MPTITSQRTGPAARRQRRRTRQRDKVLPITFPHRQRNHRRSIPKRQLREQSADVDDCFEDCQQLGYHLDPDVYVGSLTAQGNPFSVLDPDYSTHSTPNPIPTLHQDHTILTPNPFLGEVEWHVAKKSYPMFEDIERPTFNQTEERKEPLLPLSKFWRHSHGQIDDTEADRSSVRKAPPSTAQPTIPTTPPSGASFKLPGSFTQDLPPAPTPRPTKKRKLNDTPLPSFVTTYRVPSPLLYHKPSRDNLLSINDEDNTCICLGPSFEHTREEYQSSCGSKSNASWDQQPSIELESEATRPLLQNQYRFVAAALPNMGTATPYSPIEHAVFCSDADFYTNTRPYLFPRRSPVNSRAATGSSTPNTGRSSAPFAKAQSLTSHIYAADDLRLTNTPLPANFISLPVVSAPEQSSALQQPQPVHRSHDLVFPQLPSSGVFRDRSLDRYFERTINFWSKTRKTDQKQKVERFTLNKDTVENVQERPSKFQELWDAYEKAVLGPKNQESAPAKAPSVLSRPLCPFPDQKTLPMISLPGRKKGSTLFTAPLNPVRPTPIDLKPPKELDVPAWLFSPCTALIPAKQYEIQYLGMARRINANFCSLEQHSLPSSNTVFEKIKQTQSHGKIQQAVDWLIEGLNLDKMFDDESEDEGAYLPWLQAGWDGHLFYPEVIAFEIPLPLSSPFEDVELSDGGQIDDSDSWGGTQASEEAEENMWWDWDNDASGWSELSEGEFFDFES